MDSDSPARERAAAYPGSALIALVCGVVAVLLVGPLPLASLCLAAVAVVGGWTSRRKLQADPELRGAGISLAGFLLGTGVLVVGLLPRLVSWVTIAAAGMQA